LVKAEELVREPVALSSEGPQIVRPAAPLPVVKAELREPVPFPWVRGRR